jgi:serine/threonine-protein kinase
MPSPHRFAPAVLRSSLGTSYEINRVLGNGGIGQVYLAQQRFGEQLLLALKILRPDAPRAARRLFYHEGELLPRLQHPHIVQLFERGRGALSYVGPVDYLALNYMAGESLEDLVVAAGRPLAPSVMLGIVGQLTDALDYLHQRGVVHCDIKPANVMIARGSPTAVLIDFGIARAPDYIGPPLAVGTPQYMAPEQCDVAAPCDGRTDLYALGVLIFELLVGRRLFPQRSTNTIQQGLDITPDSFSLAADLGPSIAQVILRCLQRDPSDRFPSASALMAELCAAVDLPAPADDE